MIYKQEKTSLFPELLKYHKSEKVMGDQKIKHKIKEYSSGKVITPVCVCVCVCVCVKSKPRTAEDLTHWLTG